MAYNYHDAGPQGLPINGAFTDHNYNNNEQHPLYGLDQSAVLNTHDQSYLNNFFNDPNAAIPLPIVPNTTFDLNLKPDSNHSPNMDLNNNLQRNFNAPPRSMSVSNAHHQGNPVAFMSTSPTSYKTQGEMMHGMLGEAQHTPNWVQPAPVNTASKDSAAATSLMNLKSTHPQDPSLSFATNGQQPTAGAPGNWNNFSNPFYNSNMPPPTGNFVGTAQPRHASMSHATRPQNDYINHLARVQQSATQAQRQNSQPAANERPRHMSLDAQSPQLATTPRQQGAATALIPVPPRPHIPIRFGSDDNFGTAGYRAPTMPRPTTDKTQNLVLAFGLQGSDGAAAAAARATFSPDDLAQAAAIAGRDSSGMHSAPGNIGGYAPPSNAHLGQPGATNAWPVESDAQDSYSTEPARKRRKSHINGDAGAAVDASGSAKSRARNVKRGHSEEADLQASAAASDAKRRKSTHAPVHDDSGRSASPNAPAGDDDDDEDNGVGSKKKARGKQKARENLSENQKRQNHIMSEKKRRDIINNGYGDLDKLVPALAGGKSGLSRSEKLLEAATHIEVLKESLSKFDRIMGEDVNGQPIAGASTMSASHAGSGEPYYGEQTYYDE